MKITFKFAAVAVSLAAFADVRTVDMEPGENWWGAANFFGTNMPFTAKTDLKIDLRRRNYSNQCASMLISDRGRVIWADAQSEIVVKGGAITMDADSPVVVETAGKDGEPILRNLEYNYPGMGYAGIIDEFMMGDELLVAPVLKKGAQSRKVVLPPGKWKADDGQVYDGPATIEVAAPLSRLPYFVKHSFAAN